ncbi:dephospho-CoA kinase [Sphingomonas sp. YR710]|jgi:dephospho-CoA kinase|uniref:dephospho-CoA kinase n=1 Tax=Sphingomonas sp. YR710 TaxID=1882773 RepID=UPI000888F12D|nr:dephospho-CoA kinase [Sphingomonas sp. YR710]SDC33479.1 dephospho-CoA kinase [Sphingomonas sp. YR710]
MILLGLTGSIGMGKSAVAEMFRKAGVPVYDADAEVHKLQGPGGKLVAAIDALFPGTATPQGIDRAALGRAVLGDRAELRKLERLIHPALAESRRVFLRRYRSRPVVVLDVPLLFEKKGWRSVDATVVVSAPAWKQARRVLARPGMNPLKLKHIRSLQVPDREKRRRADFVIDTGVQIDRTKSRIRDLLACLRAHGVRYCKACEKSSSTLKQPA